MGHSLIKLMEHQKFNNLQKGKTKKNNHKTIKSEKEKTALERIECTLISKGNEIQRKQG